MASSDATLSLQVPEEHGAWGILLVPFLSAAGVAGRWNTPLLLAAVCMLSLFLLRASVSRHLSGPNRGESQAPRSVGKALLAPTHLLLVAVSGGAGGLLVFLFRRYELLWLGALAAALFWVRNLLIQGHARQRREKRSLSAELMGVALLTLSAPAAWIASRGSLFHRETMTGRGEPLGMQVWLLNLLFFLGGILYVKYRVRGLLAHRRFGGMRERLAFAWPVFLYHLLLAAFVTGWAVFNSRSAAGHSAALRSGVLALAFVPGILRASRLLFEMGQQFPIRRLGWAEITHSVAFASLLILGMRLAA
ncbi:MAG: YwiC-like family protein [Acidobacteria bacterium]|nr:YwiC-like family protein [Acidobacteriota bacterium]